MKRPQSDSNAAFWYACRDGDLVKARRLVQTGRVHINWVKVDHYYDDSALMIAALKGHSRVVSYLLSLPGICVNNTDRFGESALHLMCRCPNQVILRILLRHSLTHAAPRSKDGCTPLWFACQELNHAAIHMLLASGKELDLGARRIWSHNIYANLTASEMLCKNLTELSHNPRIREASATLALLDRYGVSPRKVTKEVRRKLAWTTPAAQLMALILLLEGGKIGH